MDREAISKILILIKSMKIHVKKLFLPYDKRIGGPQSLFLTLKNVRYVTNMLAFFFGKRVLENKFSL